ncbi:MAG: prolyl-tRNA synthetase associated domain-containing protein [Oscillospiraceae bacterium]|nr:prolyl-tRNA synthetase associated domain-containing protein [Oscillospiraceae bacterium]
MPYVSEIQTSAPAQYKTPLQEQVYKILAALHIPFERVDTDEVIAMDDCEAVNDKLDMKMVKTLFLCDRKQTRFYLFVTAGDKPFRSKEFSNALGVSRLSFAPADRMEQMLGTGIGAATVFSALLDTAEDVRIVFDREVASGQWYGCSDGTTTGYMKIETARIINDFLPYAGRKATVVTV